MTSKYVSMRMAFGKTWDDMNRALFLLCAHTVVLLFTTGCSGDLDEPGGEVIPPETIEGRTRPQELARYDRDKRSYATPVGSEDLVILPGEPVGLLAASDATTDTVYIVDMVTQKLRHKVAFAPGTHPGRLAVQGDELLVVLRRSGELARIDRDGRVTRRTDVCPAPRGVAFDARRDRVWVSCASGELVWLTSDELHIGETFYLAPDLRDVALVSEHLFVSSFRAAEVLRVDPDRGDILARRPAPPPNPWDSSSDHVNSLWRMIATRDGQGLLMSYHQIRFSTLTIVSEFGGYYNASGERRGIACGLGPVSPVVARVVLDEDGEWESSGDLRCAGGSALPVDVDDDTCGHGFALLAAPSIVDIDPRLRRDVPSSSCAPEPHIGRFDIRLAATIDAFGRPLILSRGEGLHLNFTHPASGHQRITLDDASPTHLGQLLFHGDLGSGMACASCHPEGGDDGQVWTFTRADLDEETGVVKRTSFRRRTQSLRAGIEGRLHWDGEFDDVGDLMGEVFSSRMSGFDLVDGDSEAIADWLAQLEPEPGVTAAPETRELVSRGEQLYLEAGCDQCHVGEMLTDFEFHDVGTGGLRKTPTLRGVGQRKRLMSNGCAFGLEQRFVCGGDQHGDLSGFGEGDLEALIAYLVTL